MTKEEKQELGSKLALKARSFLKGTDTGVPDPDAAILWYEKAMKLGYVDALNELGAAYLVKEDYEQAYYWFLEAALGGDKNCLYNMGNLYYKGQYVDQDKEKAYRYFREAYQCGVWDACFYMGYYAECGLFEDQDYEKAAKYYSEGVSHGCGPSALNLGRLYSTGQGVPVDLEKGHQYALMAYEDDVPEACQNLAVDYENGYGTEQDLAKAIALYREGAEKGDETCRKALERLNAEGLADGQ